MPLATIVRVDYGAAPTEPRVDAPATGFRVLDY
jgi:hypothetical protein